MPDALKDNFNDELVAELSDRLESIEPHRFDRARFIAEMTPTLHDLELKDRVALVADAIRVAIDAEYPDALAAVVAVSETELNPWTGWALCSFIERHGLDHPDRSLSAMETVTRSFSCEFAVRPYLERHLELTTRFLRRWVTSSDEHVRRLVSEGTRPLLPWGPRVAALTEDPTIGLELVGQLRHDESETVRRSVANHLNDIAKADPALVVKTLTEWIEDDPPVNDKMVRHALRTLVKQGHPGALGLLGFTIDPHVNVVAFTCEPDSVDLGTRIELAATIASTAPEAQLLVVDFVIHHRTARGGTSPKVFKWTTLDLAPGEEQTIIKRRLIQNASTRTYYPGEHVVELQIAGRTLATTSFTIRPGAP